MKPSTHKEVKGLDTFEAIQYLDEHSEHHDEWSRTGMYEAIQHVLRSDKLYFSKVELNKLLEEAKDR